MFTRVNRSIELVVFGWFIELLLMKYTYPASTQFSWGEGGGQVLWRKYQLRLEYRRQRGMTTSDGIKLLEGLLQVKRLKRTEHAVFTYNAW
jgi:hypothetical protein